MADAELNGLPLGEEPPKDVVDLDSLGREPGPGQSWLIVDLDLPDLFGQVVNLEKGDTVAGARAFHKVGESQVVCMHMKDLCLPDIVAWAEGQMVKVRAANLMELLAGIGGKKEAEDADLRDLLGKADGAGNGPAPAKKREPAEDE